MEQIVMSRDGNMVEIKIPRAEDALENAKEKGSEFWKMAKENGQSLWSGAWLSGGGEWGQTKGFIQEHPVQAVGYAVLLGAALTILLYPKAQVQGHMEHTEIPPL